MEITFIQAVLIGLSTWLGSQPTPVLFGTTGGFWTMGRPLIAGTIAGIILGNPTQGMIIGANISLIFLGVIVPGGAVATDVVFAGYLGTTIALASGVSTEVAVSLAVPLGLFGAFTWNVWTTLGVPLGHLADKAALEGSTKPIWVWNVVVPQLLNFAFRFIPAFLVAWYGADIGSTISEVIPAWLNNALGSIGTLLPAIGMAMLLKMLIKDNKQWSFFIIGFILVAVANVSLVPVTLVGGAIALMIMYLKDITKSKAQLEEEEF